MARMSKHSEVLRGVTKQNKTKQNRPTTTQIGLLHQYLPSCLRGSPVRGRLNCVTQSQSGVWLAETSHLKDESLQGGRNRSCSPSPAACQWLPLHGGSVPASGRHRAVLMHVEGEAPTSRTVVSSR